MADEKVEALIRENERLRSALRAVRSYAAECSFGSWRFMVAKLADNGLSK